MYSLVRFVILTVVTVKIITAIIDSSNVVCNI